MALRRRNRSIEVFDIALMAVVTKAMGAFLVLMLIMLPSYNQAPAMEQTVADANAKRQQLAVKVAALQQRNAELKSGGSEEARLEQRRTALEQENKQLREGSDTISMVITFSWADCYADRFHFYVWGENTKLPNGADWPPVHPMWQPAPPSIVQYGSSSSNDLIWHAPSDLVDPRAAAPLQDLFVGFLGMIVRPSADELKPILQDLGERSKKQMLWAFDNVRPNARFAIYAQPDRLLAPCRPHIALLFTGVDEVRLDPSGSQWNNWTVQPAQSNSVVHLGHLEWTGKEMHLLNATEADQTALDAQLKNLR
jgi:cell division protein FtsB